MAGLQDPFLAHLTVIQVTALICAFAAWARNSGTWGGSSCIQALSAIRHTFRSNFHDFSAFNSPTVTTLRKSLLLTDRFDEARSNRQNRLPFSLDMVADAARRSASSHDLPTIMTGTAINIASLMLLRVSEYALSSATTDTFLASDHRILASNVLYYTYESALPLSSQQLNAQRKTRRDDHKLKSVSLTLASSKADTSGEGVTFVFNAEDFDMEDPATVINMLQRWTYLANHAANDPLFSFREEHASSTTTITHLTATSVSDELRRVAILHHIPAHQLARVTPHSIRIGMATHLHNLGVTTTVILQMGRWSSKSTAAPKYQRLSAGACAIVARSTSGNAIRTAHNSTNTLQSLVRPEQHSRVFEATSSKRQRFLQSTSTTAIHCSQPSTNPVATRYTLTHANSLPCSYTRVSNNPVAASSADFHDPSQPAGRISLKSLSLASNNNLVSATATPDFHDLQQRPSSNYLPLALTSTASTNRTPSCNLQLTTVFTDKHPKQLQQHTTTHSSNSASDYVIASAVPCPTHGHSTINLPTKPLPLKKRLTSPLPGGLRLRSIP